MKSFGSIGSFLWTLLLVFLAFICMGNSVRQELWLYDAQDNAYLFHSHVSDMSNYSLLLPQVTRVCTTGVWYLYSTTNSETYYAWWGSRSSKGIVCSNFTTASSVKSLRHVGANDTDTYALSLYEGYSHSGKEIFVTARAHTGITIKIRSIAITGTSHWTLFEGQDLDGKSTCYRVPSGYYLDWNSVSNLNLTTIGSVFKGCDVQEIQNYKTLHKS